MVHVKFVARWFLFTLVLLFGCLLTGMVVSSVFTLARADEVTSPTMNPNFMEYRAGDLLTLPVRKGNFMLLLYGSSADNPIWYDGAQEWFSYLPIRNYGTVYVDITRRTPEGDYQFVEIDADKDPTKVSNWKWIRTNNVRVVKCDGFKEC